MFSFPPEFTIDQSHVHLSAWQPVRWARVRVTRPMPAHDHEFTEVSLVVEGQGIHVTGQKRSLLRAGHVLVVPPGQVHAFEKPRGLEAVNLYFLAEWFMSELRLDAAGDGLLPLFFPQALTGLAARHPIHEFAMDIRSLRQTLRELDDLARGTAAGDSPRWTSCCFLKALLIMTNACGRHIGCRPAVALPPLVWQTYAEIDRLLNAGEKLDLRVHARKLGVTRDHLGRLFRSHVGESPLSFYQRRRLQYACRLLLRTDHTLAEIAHRLGYSDQAHMCRSFLARHAMTPSAYRRKFHGRPRRRRNLS